MKSTTYRTLKETADLLGVNLEEVQPLPPLPVLSVPVLTLGDELDQTQVNSREGAGVQGGPLY